MQTPGWTGASCFVRLPAGMPDWMYVQCRSKTVSFNQVWCASHGEEGETSEQTPIRMLQDNQFPQENREEDMFQSVGVLLGRPILPHRPVPVESA
jgi:hypothetical protein